MKGGRRRKTKTGRGREYERGGGAGWEKESTVHKKKNPDQLETLAFKLIQNFFKMLRKGDPIGVVSSSILTQQAKSEYVKIRS